LNTQDYRGLKGVIMIEVIFEKNHLQAGLMRAVLSLFVMKIIAAPVPYQH
jgi:hypothetical protein